MIANKMGDLGYLTPSHNLYYDVLINSSPGFDIVKR